MSGIADSQSCRILLSEGTSTSARQAITALGLSGYEVEICDPSPWCPARFSRFAHRFHRCPGMGEDPSGYLEFMLGLMTESRFDVLLPIHEQGLLFAKAQDRLPPGTVLASASFHAYRRVLSKSGFDALLLELDLHRPPTRLVGSADQLRALKPWPCVLKLPIGTASRGTWIVQDAAELERAIGELENGSGFDDTVLVQDFVAGGVEHAQAVFAHGRLVGVHMYRQLARGAGGGPSLKESVHRPDVERHLDKMGRALRWHGALSVDYIVSDHDKLPFYIDCNPRLVEPMSAWFAGADLADLLVRVSLGEQPHGIARGEPGVRTHLSLQALLGCAQQSGSRLALIADCLRLLSGRGVYRESQEELTPWRYDKLSVIPVLLAAVMLLIRPAAAHDLPRRGWGRHLLTPDAIRFAEQLTTLRPSGRDS
jgi:predicted ATP-grasp superfamily ATP-dependent carboligase